jgi:AcrR family transcriptional regulator
MVRTSNTRSKSRPAAAGAGAGSLRAARRHRARRLLILAAAARAFRDRGFASTGMREIAAAADLSPANLYHYFRGKHELLYFCQEASLERLHESLRTVARSQQPAAAQLRFVLAAHVQCVLGEMEGATAHLEVEDLPPALKRRIIAGRDRYERGVRGLVAAGIASGEFERCDADLVTRAMLGAVNWTARWYRPQGERTPAEVGAAYAEYLVRGLEARGQRDGRGRV